MSIPASLAISKLRYPETEETLTTGRVVIPDEDEHKAANSLHAFANGAWLGLKIAGMILSNLLCIIALLGLANGLLTWWGRYLNINDPPLTIELIVGYICYPIAFLLGVPRNGGTHPFKSCLVVQYRFVSRKPCCCIGTSFPDRLCPMDLSWICKYLQEVLTLRSCRRPESCPAHRYKARC